MIREKVHEEVIDGVTVEVYTIHGSGVYQPEWNGNLGYGYPTVRQAVAAVRDRLAWDGVAAADAGKH